MLDRSEAIICWLLFSSVSAEIIVTSSVNDLPAGFSVTEFVNGLGYPLEYHQRIPTEDGYLLNIMRIPHGRNNSSTSGKKPVAFFMPGLINPPEFYLINGAVGQSLALLLADRGYDVWLGDARGTLHSSNHTSLDPDQDPEFWNFSWHEIGYYDLPAMIHYVLDVTNQSDLFYVGHSQGGTAFFVMTSMRPEMNKAIKLMVGLAPGAFYGGPIKLSSSLTATIIGFLENLASSLGITNFSPGTFSRLCEIGDMFGIPKDFCFFSSYIGGGVDPLFTDPEVFELVTKAAIDIGSIKQMLHYLQIIATSTFQMYDYGVERNVEVYGQESPPHYNLENITAPVAVYYGIGDFFSTPANSLRLVKRLPNVVVYKQVMRPYFTHLDFLLHRNIINVLYNNVFRLMDSYVRN